MRTKSDIAKTYRAHLIEQGKPKEVVDEFTEDELIAIVVEKCYSTEEIEGKKVSSVDAWYHFCHFIIHEDSITGQKVWNKFVREVFEICEGNTQTCFTASRGLGKSYITFVLYPLFKTFLFSHTDVLIVTNIPKMARRNLRVLKRTVDENELLLEKKDVSNLRDLKWGDKEVVYNEGFIETLSIGTTPRSAHVPLVILDDPLRDDNKYSDEHIFDFVRAQLLPCIKRLHGRLIVNGTVQSSTDIFHRLMNTDADGNGKLIRDGGISALGFYSKAFPAITNFETKEVYMPEVYTWDELMEIKTIQGDILFTREYLVQVVSDDFAIFPEGMVRKCTRPAEYQLESVGRPGATYVIGVDLASSASRTADYSAFCVLEYNTDKGTKILRALVNERMTAEEQEKTLMSLARKFNNAFVYVEKNNIGEYIRQKLENNNIFCEGFTTNKENKANAIKFLRSEMVNKRIFFPEWEEETEVLKKQLINFGYKTVRGVKTMAALTGHDDAVDALWIANLATQQLDVMPSEAIVQQ